MSDTYLILGGSNSGKSRFAEQSALSLQKNIDGKLYYIATGLAYDSEMPVSYTHLTLPTRLMV